MGRELPGSCIASCCAQAAFLASAEPPELKSVLKAVLIQHPQDAWAGQQEALWHTREVKAALGLLGLCPSPEACSTCSSEPTRTRHPVILSGLSTQLPAKPTA